MGAVWAAIVADVVDEMDLVISLVVVLELAIATIFEDDMMDLVAVTVVVFRVVEAITGEMAASANTDTRLRKCIVDSEMFLYEQMVCWVDERPHHIYVCKYVY